MYRYDIHNRFAFGVALAAASTADNTPLVGALIDTQGTDGTEFVVQSGAIATAGASFAVTLEHGNDPALADAAVASGYDIFGGAVSFAGTDANKVKTIGYAGINRYVRVKITPTGNAGAAAFSAAVVSRGRYRGYVG